MIIDKSAFDYRSFAFVYRLENDRLIALYTCGLATPLTVVNRNAQPPFETAYRQGFEGYDDRDSRTGPVAVKRITFDGLQAPDALANLQYMSTEQIFIDGEGREKDTYYEILLDKFPKICADTESEIADYLAYLEGL